ncbi:response regulator [Cytobacillus firmus DS1]|uniref:Response regulator n=2 Tax=Cytobacillus TaxID=2675230 RepID=W7LBA5_CYTFI|nr:response regulator [Cytobacillus firmus DS1]
MREKIKKAGGKMGKTILVVDDDHDIVRLITESLKFEQFYTIQAYSGKKALYYLKENKIDFVVLDIMMPEMDGLEVCRKIRSEYNIPILLLSARSRDMDKIIGLEIGADDYMTKPFSIQELTSRIKAHFRKVDRLHQEWNGIIKEKEVKFLNSNSPLVLNDKTYEAFLNHQKLELSTKEFQILSFLKNHPNNVLTREQIYDSVWGDEYGDLNTVTVHIKNIRKKIGVQHDFIKTVWGVGYKYIEGNTST